MPSLTCACPECGRSIDRAARRCKHCRSLLPDGWAQGQVVVAHHRTTLQRVRSSFRHRRRSHLR